jgi:hypothetical protein
MGKPYSSEKDSKPLVEKELSAILECLLDKNKKKCKLCNYSTMCSYLIKAVITFHSKNP